jgi:thioredoxin
MPILTCPKCGAKNRVDERAAKMQPVCGRCGTKLSTAAPAAGPADGHPITITDANFDETVSRSAGKPVLVDAWAPWCGPCRLIAPTLDQLAAESAGRYVVAKLNIDENPRTAAKYNISSIPTLLLFKNGQLAEKLVGVQPKPVIASRLQALV